MQILCMLLRRLNRQHKIKLTAFSWFAIATHPPAMRANKLTSDGQPKSRSRFRRVRNSEEAIKNPRLILRWHTRAFVHHAEINFSVLPPRTHNDFLSVRREFDRVRQKIREHMANTLAVRLHWRKLGRGFWLYTPF